MHNLPIQVEMPNLFAHLDQLPAALVFPTILLHAELAIFHAPLARIAAALIAAMHHVVVPKLQFWVAISIPLGCFAL